MSQLNRSKKIITIIGASISGLLSAVVCSSTFDEIIILERGVAFQGVPHQNHIHVLQAKGLEILEDILPGITAELTASGAIDVDWTEDTFVWLSRGFVPQIDAKISSLGMSRALLENVIRERVHQIPNISIKYRHEVQSLVIYKNSITDLMILDRENNSSFLFKTDMLIDCSGRNSKSPEWLTQNGYRIPEDIVVNSFLGYSSRWYSIPDKIELEVSGIAIQPKPHENFYRGVAVGVVEDRKVVITLVGVNKDYPPTRENEFKAFAQTLQQPIITELLESLTPISAIRGYRAYNRLRQYHNMNNYPANLFILGDAYCSFNPIYGQGMMVAVMSVKTLQQYLKANNDAVSKGLGFQKKLFWTVLISWIMATGEDMRYPLVEGKRRNILDRGAHLFLDFLFVACIRDELVGTTLLQVIHHLKSPLYLVSPILLLRALVAFFFRKPLVDDPSNVSVLRENAP